MLVDYMDIFSETPCEFCSCKNNEECHELQQNCAIGVIKWLEEAEENE